MKKGLPFILIGIVVLLLVLLQKAVPRAINWYETYEKRDKNPYGEFVMYDLLKEIFPDKKIEVKKRTLYEVLGYYDYTETDYSYQNDTATIENSYEGGPTYEYTEDSSLVPADSSVTEETNSTDEANEDELANSVVIGDLKNSIDTSLLRNYIIINSSFSPGESDTRSLLEFVEKGNCAFVSAQTIEGMFADSLKLKIKIGYYEKDFSTDDVITNPTKDSIYLVLLNSNLKTKNKKYWYKDGTVTGFFASFDTLSTTVLGKNSKGEANFIRIRYGEGSFLISTTPLAFTNYNLLLANNAEYIAASFSYLPVRDTYWDEYYKNYNIKDSNRLQFITSQPPLNWALYIAIFGGGAYVLFEAKRRQRVIPIVEPPKNSTVEFVSTIGRLYFQNGSHKDIGMKRIHYFLEHIRSNYYITTTVFDQSFVDKISQRSGFDKTKVAQLFSLIQYFQNTFDVSQKDLMELSKKIEEFKKAE